MYHLNLENNLFDQSRFLLDRLMRDQNMNNFVGTLLLIVASTISLSGSQRLQCSYFTSPKYLVASATEKWIELPSKSINYEKKTYKPNQDCKWIIGTEEEDHVIELTVVSMQLEGQDIREDCLADYIDIEDVLDGHNVFKDRLCGIGSDISFLSSQSAMVLHFVSDRRYQYGGFRVAYRSVQEPEETNFNEIGPVLGISAGVFLLIVIMVAVLLLYRKRKRKTSERNQRRQFNNSPNAQMERTLSPIPTSRQTQTSDLSPFVNSERYQAQELQLGLAVSLRDGRPATPPPAYEVIDSQENYIDLPPPSYDSVLRESSHVDSAYPESTFASNSNA